MERINAPGHLAHLAGDAREKIHATADNLRHWDAKELGEHEYLVLKASEWLREYEGIIERQQIRYDRMKAQRDEARERAATPSLDCPGNALCKEHRTDKAKGGG